MLDFAIFAVTFLLILVGAVLYLYPASRQASGIPGLAPTDEKDGNLPDIIASSSLHEFLVNLHEKYGPLVSFWFGRRLVVSLGSIDLLKQHINPNRLPLMEMESTLRKITKERRGRAFNRHIFIDTLLQGSLSDQQILEDTMIFSLAGCIITANLCTWAVYFLTTSEDVQQNLYKEMDRVLGKGPITHEKIEQLRYCRQVLCETVRTAKLTPIAAQLQELEGRVDQHTIPKETLVLYALGVMLQDSSSWPSPYKFDPERFNEESAMKNLSLLGFSGSQECPELRFAYMVATVLLSVLVRKLHLHPVKGQVMETKYELVTSPKEEAWITVSKRS
ncbi:cytochrome P450 20A1 isoform X3 [Falco biarmicus]|uniref:cytochrome P450 20A1 isoform X3 n=1 Tax=Falco rusticolus TaxID=120794 RepID=UPI00188660EC|nr:cytochrome P450 20A1 isoform X3 [Falco rusticolus]XP_055575299.1 cytochrome P450 20A1 isoform X3 [Falco cherrug]XP_055669049.1 cytochrome P450 20A1 isoform X3 [Falco peregrinus]XP_056206279.1 cytochrome P450 20A1 isoform X3 [Falco biarmicus]